MLALEQSAAIWLFQFFRVYSFLCADMISEDGQ